MHPDSERLATYISKHSEHARAGSETFACTALCGALGMSQADMDLAVNELEEQGLIKTHARGAAAVVMAEADLFQRFDPEVKGWDAEDDALTVAKKSIENGQSSSTADIAKALDWPPRRMNPACERLHAAGKVNVRKFMGGGPFTYGNLIVTDATRRLARDGW